MVTDGGQAAAGGALDEVDVPLRLIDPDAVVPAYAHATDAGADLSARVDVVIGPGERAVVPTGVALAIPAGFVGLVHPRSGLAAKHGLTVLNAPGTIDADYRGEVCVVLVNTDPSTPVTVRRGDRIAQLLVQRVSHARWQLVPALPDTTRGDGGFGSTGGFLPAAGKDT